MQCKKCGSEQLKVYKTKRNRKWDAEKREWVVDFNADSRELICLDCDSRYITTSYMDCALVYKPEKSKLVRVPIEKFTRDCEREISRSQETLFDRR